MRDTPNFEIRLEWNDGEPKVYELRSGSELVIGRDPQSGIALRQAKVSWRHAVVSADGRSTVTDLDATNGTFLNGNRLPSRRASVLAPGDTLRIGDTEFRCIGAARHPQAEQPQPQDGRDAGGHSEGTRAIQVSNASELLIGRSSSAAVIVDHPQVSWRHARLKRTGSSWELEDLGSTNGTFVNGHRINSCSIKAGDRIQIGLSRLIFDSEEIQLSDDAGHLEMAAQGLWKTIWKGGRPLHLLRDVSLRVKPRQMVAIAGASGAGKSTLLRALNGYSPATRGQVRINGVDFYKHREMLRSAIGYVPQDDIVHGELSVQSALQYAARLRLPSDTRADEIASLVAKTLCDLELDGLRTNLIRTLSGGERKRLNIGVELLTRPGILFLDEPTTGLDAGLERRVTQLLRHLANDGRTVIVVTHAAATLDQYDVVAFLARGGRLVFCGAPRDALRFFGAVDFAGVYDILNDPAQAARFNSPTPDNGFHGDGDAARAAASSGLPARQTAAPLGQLVTLLARYAEIVRSDVRNLALWLAQAPIVALLIALLFDHDTFASPQIRDAAGDWPIHGAPRMLFLLTFSLICFGLCNAAREIVKESAIYERERHISLRIGPYCLSKVLLMGAFAAVQCVALLGIVALIVPFGMGYEDWGSALVLLFLGALNAILLGLVVSALASSVDQAITIVAVLLLFQVLFSGLVPLDKLPAVMRSVASMCDTRWSYGGLSGVLDLGGRWQALGLGAWVDEIMRTKPRDAVAVLCALAGVKGALLWGALEWKGSNRR